MAELEELFECFNEPQEDTSELKPVVIEEDAAER